MGRAEEDASRGVLSQLEQELWTLTMKGSEINAYTVTFSDLAVMCPALIERYIWGVASQIKGMVIESKPTTYDSAKCIAHQLTSTEIQRKFNGKNPIQSSETNYVVTTTIPMQPRKYAGKLPWCTQYNRHHLGNCSRDTVPISTGAKHLQQKIKEQTLEHDMMEEERVLSVVKLDISRRNVQS
uniref:Retrotransposon gag domain-containing protein n=1 Tax=Lactuca sativa TaxID=4236 RepID=A0A9R1WKU6_LACSA|nr:hypothetical protein LSAT_V11C100045830 [Lactuca sativa]